MADLLAELISCMQTIVEIVVPFGLHITGAAALCGWTRVYLTWPV